MEAAIIPAAPVRPARRVGDALIALLLWLLVLGPFLHAHAGPAAAGGWHLPESRMAGDPALSTIGIGLAVTDTRDVLSALPDQGAPSAQAGASPADGEPLPIARPTRPRPSTAADAPPCRAADPGPRPGSSQRRPPPQAPPVHV